MAEDTKIEWTDHTFNPWRGCTKVSAGCANCYAETLSKRNPGALGEWGPTGKRVVAAESYWQQPLRWNLAAGKAGERRQVFCASLADVFEDWTGPVWRSTNTMEFKHELCVCHGCGRLKSYVAYCHEDCHEERLPRRATMADVRRRLFNLISITPNLDWLLLTKRPENVLRMTYDAWTVKVKDHVSQNEGDGRHWAWPSNVWLGVSVEDQQRADERIPLLLQTPAAVRFLSCEPLLGPIEFSNMTKRSDAVQQLGKKALAGIDWVIVGGESGSGARPCNIAWIRSLVQQCQAAGVPAFVKQLGRHVVCANDDVAEWFDDRGYLQMGPTDRHQGATGRVFGFNDTKGGDPSEWPAGLRVREWPASAQPA